VQFAAASASRIGATAAAASSVLTVTRTSSEPASASARNLRDRSRDVGRVGVGHRLDDDGCAAADPHAANVDCNGRVPLALRNRSLHGA